MFSLFLDVLVLRLYEESKLYEFARHSKIPIINGLTNESHPCQVLTDIFTFQEIRGSIVGKKVVWLGVANNVFQSFLHAASSLNFRLFFSGPSKFEPTEKMLEDNKDKATDEEVTAINSANDKLKKLLESEDLSIDDLKISIDELAKASQSFAEKLYAESQNDTANPSSDESDDIVEGEVIEDE